MGFIRVTIILLFSTTKTAKSLENITAFNDETDYRSNLEQKERADLSRLCNELSTFIPDVCSYKYVQQRCKQICCKETGNEWIELSKKATVCPICLFTVK